MENKLVSLPPKSYIIFKKLILIEIMISINKASLRKMDICFFLCVDPTFYINA